MIIRERAIKYGDNVDTDVIIPARYLNTSDDRELASHCFEGLDNDFRDKVKDRKIIVAGNNFGCGSSREHAPLSIKTNGVKAIIAASFSRIFFRNSINIGLPVISSKEAADFIQDGDELELDFSSGKIKDITRDRVFEINPLPEFIQSVIKSGGYINFIKEGLKR